ncbi:Zinc finger BED domain-containing protein 5-like 9, partial [Homarus americanus]
MKPFQEKQHPEKLHLGLAQKDRTFFKQISDGLKRLRLDGTVLPRHKCHSNYHGSDEDPFKCHVDVVPTELQEEFLELKHNSSAKDEFNFLSLSEIWVKMYPIYPGFGNSALRALIPFSSTYL